MKIQHSETILLDYERRIAIWYWGWRRPKNWKDIGKGFSIRIGEHVFSVTLKEANR